MLNVSRSHSHLVTARSSGNPVNGKRATRIWAEMPYIITDIFVITFMHSIYNYIPETNHVSGYIVLQLFTIYNLCYM